MSVTGMQTSSDGKFLRERRPMTEAKAKLRRRAGMVQTRLDDVAGNARLYVGRAKTGLEEFRASALQTARDRPAASALTILTVGIAIGAVLALTLRQPAGRLTHTALDGGRRFRRRFPW